MRADDTSEIVRDPVCGMEVDPAISERKIDHNGREYHFCSDSCQETFSADSSAFFEAVDPVCGMSVDRATARYVSKVAGEPHFFCSAGCKEKFDEAPESYLGGRPAPEAMPEGTIYTCPMHPEIEKVGPGDCPICGMALEPKGIPAGDEGPNPELVDFTRRFWIGTILTVPVVVLAMGGYVGLPVRSWIGEGLAHWLELILATPVILWSGWPFLVRGWKSFRTMNLNMFSLIGMGVAAAWAFSTIAVIAPGLFPSGFLDADGTVGVYF